MKTVWLTMLCVPYEGDDVIGVFDTETRAQECAGLVREDTRSDGVTVIVRKWKVGAVDNLYGPEGWPRNSNPS